MHDSIAKEVKKFNNKYLNGGEVIAELGSLNINGSIREHLPHLIGFDICEGKDVDVVIVPGVIPEQHIGEFDCVVSSSSFHFCPKPELYKKQIVDLLKPGGLVWLSMCGPECKRHHSTSKNQYGFTDCFRMTKKELRRFLEPNIEKIESYYGGDNHHQDMFYIGKKV